MYCSWEKPLREEKLRKHPKNPSFSSILLDEIFNSIDGNEQNTNETKHVRNQYSRKPNNGVEYIKIKATSNCKEGEQMASMKRASLVEKLMEKKVNEKICSLKKVSYLPEFDNLRSLHDNDPIFFSTSSSSSSESSSGALSSSEAEIFYNSSSTKSRNGTSCFSTKSSSKPNKSASNFPPRPRKNNHPDSSNYKQSECYIFDDFYNTTQQSNCHENEDNLMKSKSRAMKIYNNLKKVKQPISPGGRLTSFITSLFASGNVKKSKEVKPSSTNGSTCSSASLFSRSCMSKSAPTSRGKFDDYGVRKRVHFYPVSVIVDEDARPCGHKSINDEEFDRFKGQTRSYQSLETLKTRVLERNKNIDQEVTRDVLLKGFKDQQKDEDFDNDDYEENEDHVDGVSDCSSDLFEIDHLEVFRNTRFCEELPVYETTHLDRNRAIARGLKV
ncbi:hypothetical protein LIER_28138 [Lithospermum erythrorhizon]|uniref:Protein BIG GRAIN 1-like B n=1 Tax=Lithospermum erythrorhizon TaxID=34254 RepID=A0AAV3RIM5_LITER